MIYITAPDRKLLSQNNFTEQRHEIGFLTNVREMYLVTTLYYHTGPCNALHARTMLIEFTFFE